MSAIGLNLNSTVCADIPVPPGAMEAIERVQAAYQKFITPSRDVRELRAKRNEYFSTINQLHTTLFSDSDSAMNRGFYLARAENILKNRWNFKDYPLAVYRLNGAAKEYLNAFESFNKVLASSPQPAFSEIKQKVEQLEKAHLNFSFKYVDEYKGLGKYREITQKLLGLFAITGLLNHLA